MKETQTRIITGLLVAVVSAGCVTNNGVDCPRLEKPEVATITPTTATPGVEVDLEGYRLGMVGTNWEKVRVMFVQRAVRRSVEPTGGGGEIANIRSGLQQMVVTVPDGLEPGACQIVVDVAGQCSEPRPFNIGSAAIPPVLISIVPPNAAPGEVVSVYGRGFSKSSDHCLLTDASGAVHRIVNGEVTNESGETYHANNCGTGSSAQWCGVTLPMNIPEGKASLRIVSGTNQASNPLPLMISRGPVPLYIFEDLLRPVAPGQCLDVVVSDGPSTGATRVEYAFRQKDNVVLIVTDLLDCLHVPVPKVLVAGDVEIQTRTWVGDTVSAWSDAVTLQLLDRPAAACIYSVEVVPVRAEVAFHGRNGVDAIYVGPDTPPQLSVYKGEGLILNGGFPATSMHSVEVVLSNWRREVRLRPTSTRNKEVTVRLPDDMTSGNWRVSVHSLEDHTVTRLPFTLRVEPPSSRRQVWIPQLR